jgi:signal transduction histidine kinase/ActR/RegA family two-component response regulator
MPCDVHTDAAPPETLVRPILDFAHRLLTGGETAPLSLDGVLDELASVCGVRGAGLVSLPDGADLAKSSHAPTVAPETYPWRARPELLGHVGSAPGAVFVSQDSGGLFVLAAVSQHNAAHQLLWVAPCAARPWTDGERAALTIAAQAFGHMVDASGAGPRWAQQLQRVTRQRRLEDAAIVTRRVSHDLGNLLTGVLGFTELAQAQVEPASPAHVYLQELFHAVQQATQVTARLRSFSRRTTVPFKPGDLRSALAEQEARLKHAELESFRISAAPELPPVAASAETLKTILGHVVDNAREAITGAGAITLTARPVQLTAAECLDLYGEASAGPHVEITVTDDGSGLSAEARQRLFAEPLFTDKPRHRGLGLAVVYGLLCAHHGGLDVAPGPDRGTVVRLYLPAAASSPVTASAGRPNGCGPSRGERVLVVDDDPMVLRLCTATLERAGYRVQTATTATEALDSYRAAAAEPFHLVVSDVAMPRMTGVDLERRLRSQDGNVNVLFMSGQVSPSFPKEALGGRPYDFLSKPFRPEGLLCAVRSALDRASPSAPASAGGPG